MSRFVLYEVQAFGSLFLVVGQRGRSDLQDFEASTPEWWTGNSLLDAFLVHTRLVDEFLYGDIIEAEKAKGSTDTRVSLEQNAVYALDFVKDPQRWLDERPLRSEVLTRTRTRLNRSFTHLDWRRLKSKEGDEHNPFSSEQTWNTGDIWEALRPTIEAFLLHTEETVLCTGFHDGAQDALQFKSVRWPWDDETGKP